MPFYEENPDGYKLSPIIHFIIHRQSREYKEGSKIIFYEEESDIFLQISFTNLLVTSEAELKKWMVPDLKSVFFSLFYCCLHL